MTGEGPSQAHPNEGKDGAHDNILAQHNLHQARMEEEQTPKNTGYKTFFGQNITSSMSISQSHHDSEKSFCAMSARKRWSFYAFFFVDFCAGTFYSLLGPFFPNEARAKGISYTLTGFVFSVYPVVYIIVSPIIGRYLSKIGAKFVFITGITVCGTCAILFGCLEYVLDGTTYAVMSILVRAFQALGGVAFNTATFAMVATMFPSQMATMFGLLEVAFGLGTMSGPPVGGWLYEVGGFKLPFIISGSTLLLMGIVCFIFVPGIRESQAYPRSLWSILLSPLVVLVGLTGAVGTSGIGFIDVTLSVRLNSKFHLTPGWTGLVFFIAPAMFILSAPVWGRLADKKPAAAPIAMGIGTLFGGFAFWFLGPAEFLNIPDNQLWLVMASYGIMGLSIGTHVVNGKIMAEEARRRGHSKTLETMGMLAGLITSFNSVGSFCGPLVGGYLNDRYQFPAATTIVGTIVMAMGSLLLLCVLIQTLIRRRQYSRLPGESSMLLSDESQNSSSIVTPGDQSRANSSSTSSNKSHRCSTTPPFVRKQGIITPSSSSEASPVCHGGQEVSKISNDGAQAVAFVNRNDQNQAHSENKEDFCSGGQAGDVYSYPYGNLPPVGGAKSPGDIPNGKGSQIVNSSEGCDPKAKPDSAQLIHGPHIDGDLPNSNVSK